MFLKGLKFEDCSITGTDFTGVNNFILSVSFSGCRLDYAIFESNRFRECSIREASFIKCDLSSAKFQETELNETLFEGCNIERRISPQLKTVLSILTKTG